MEKPTDSASDERSPGAQGEPQWIRKQCAETAHPEISPARRPRPNAAIGGINREYLLQVLMCRSDINKDARRDRHHSPASSLKRTLIRRSSTTMANAAAAPNARTEDLAEAAKANDQAHRIPTAVARRSRVFRERYSRRINNIEPLRKYRRSKAGDCPEAKSEHAVFADRYRKSTKQVVPFDDCTGQDAKNSYLGSQIQEALRETVRASTDTTIMAAKK